MNIKRISIINLIDLFVAMTGFAIINIPSIKIFYSSELVNISLLMSIFILGLLRNGYKIPLSKSKINFLKIWSIFWILFLCYTPFGLYKDIITIIRYLSTYLYIVGLILFIDNKHLPSIISAQIVWGTLISFSSFYGLISLDRSLGQHYLTLGVPISASLCCLAGLIFKQRKLYHLLILTIPLLFNFYVLFSLQGRAPILLFSLVALLLFIINFRFKLISIIRSKNLLKIVFLCAILFIIFIYIQVGLENNRYLSTRFDRLFDDPTSEPRYLVYLKVLSVLLDNPFGYGIGYNDAIGYYPHNIFLEVGISTGIMGILLLCLLTKKLIYALIKNSSSNLPFNSCISVLAVYLFLTWNISFELGSSYVPFGALAILIATTDKDKKIIEVIADCQY